MWTTASRSLSCSGSVMVDVGGGTHVPLKGVLIDVYLFSSDVTGTVHFQLLNQVAQRTDTAGNFSFHNLPVVVEAQMVIPGTPPYTPVEIINANSLPNLAFRIMVESDVLRGVVPEGTQFAEIYDERDEINATWIIVHPERTHVPLAGGPAIQVLIPEGNAIAAIVAGLTVPPPVVPGRQFHFLRVGRVVREEIGELDDVRPEFVGKGGYVRSTDTWAAPKPSFFGGVYDAPFGGGLHIGGHFGADLYTRDLYYTVTVWDYSGNPAHPLAGAGQQILDLLFNKRYLLPTPALPQGKWETLNLGPFDGNITAVEPSHDTSLIGTSIKVYKRPAPPNLATEYWPFWDLIVLWNSAAGPHALRLLSLEAYERTGGSEATPELTKLAMTPSVNGLLPLMIDNRPPVPIYLPYNLAAPATKFYTSFATFIGAPESVGPSAPMGVCNEMTVTPGQPSGNECILVRYSVEDGAGSPHPHLGWYALWAEFTPKAVAGAPDSAHISLKPSFTGYRSLSESYLPHTPPILAVSNATSVIVPAAVNGWPPEQGDPWGIPTGTCPQYAVEVGLTCWVRTIDGWARLFGTPHVARHLIVKRS
ncbi:MAG: hypothetical protein HOP18_07375 [Deltaproteobacteria bacterium]|nr:hypothetical protein [Deltaproteobacteria bacterium]